MEKRPPIECPLRKERFDRKGEGCGYCVYYDRCIWFRIYEKVIYILAEVENLKEQRPSVKFPF